MYYLFRCDQFTFMHLEFGCNTEMFTANKELILYFNTMD